MAYKRSTEKICVFCKILLQLHFKLGFDPCMGPIGAEYFRGCLEGFMLPGALMLRPSWLCPCLGGRSGVAGLACDYLLYLDSPWSFPIWGAQKSTKYSTLSSHYFITKFVCDTTFYFWYLSAYGDDIILVCALRWEFCRNVVFFFLTWNRDIVVFHTWNLNDVTCPPKKRLGIIQSFLMQKFWHLGRNCWRIDV